MRLSELNPQFLKAESKTTFRRDGDIKSADGVMFLCPKCYNGTSVGVHSVICWQPTVSPEMQPSPGRWLIMGDSIDNLSLVAGSSSVKLSGGCDAHFFIRNGEIVDC